MGGKLLVIGSYNLDLISETEKLPDPGETVLGDSFFTCSGGKGNNQAVAAARLGQKTLFIARVGEDSFGKEAIAHLEKENIDTQWVQKVKDVPTGTAQIIVNQHGENTIVVFPGANNCLSETDILESESVFEEIDVVLVQQEIPYTAIREVVRLAKRYHKTLILNPAPSIELEDDLLQHIDYLTPNESELKFLTGYKTIETMEQLNQAGEVLLNKGVKNIIATLGNRGAYYAGQQGNAKIIPSFKVKAIDTTGAGDCFNGAFAVSLMKGLPIEECIRYASAAAAISVTRKGTSSSYPSWEEVQDFINTHK